MSLGPIDHDSSFFAQNIQKMHVQLLNTAFALILS